MKAQGLDKVYGFLMWNGINKPNVETYVMN